MYPRHPQVCKISNSKEFDRKEGKGVQQAVHHRKTD